jgi:PAS domain S-box-containing protein
MLNKLLPFLNDCVLALDVDKGEYLFISPNILQLSGYTINDLNEKKIDWHDLIHDSDRSEMIPVGENLQLDSCAEFNYRIRTAQNRLKWVKERRSLFIDAESGKTILLSILKDTSDRRSVNFKLKETFGDFSLLFNRNPNPMWIYEMPSLRILKVNEAAIRFYGYSEDEFLNLTIRDLRPVEDLAVFNKYVYNTGIGGSQFQGLNRGGVWRHKRKNGEIIYAEITGHEVNYGGTICRIVSATDVTERIHYQEEVKRREKFLTSLIDSQTTFLTRVNAQGIFTFVNSRILKSLGYEEKELTGMHYSSLVIKEEERKCEKVFNTCIKTPGKVTHLLHQMRDKHGNLRWTEWELIGITDDNGIVSQVQAVGQDVHDRIENEKNARLAAEKLNSFIESITDSFMLIDKESRLIRVNGAFEKLAQKSRGEILGKNLWEEFPVIKRTGFERACKQAVSGQTSVQFSEYFTEIGRWFNVIVYPSAEGLTLFIRDITSKRKAQEELIWTKNNLQALIDNTQDDIWGIDREHKLIALNSSYKNKVKVLANIEPKIGADIHVGFDAALRPEWDGYFNRALAGERYMIRKETLVPGTNETIFNEISFNPIYNAKGEVTGAGCFSRDITERINAEKAIIKQNEHLAHIASLSSHELRRPVACLLGLMDILDKKNLTNPENTDVFVHIQTVVQEIDDVIHTIVDKTFVSDEPVKPKVTS